MKLILSQLFRFFLIFFDFLIYPFIKKKNIIIAGHKSRYLIGNNEYLLDFLENNNVELNYYFYTKDRTVYDKLKNKYPNKILTPYQLRTIIKFAGAKVLIVTSGLNDFFPYPILNNRKVINLWHGAPLKTIGTYKDKKHRNSRLFAKALDYYTVSSEFEGEIIQEAFNLKKEKIFVSGILKNDYIKKDFSSLAKEYPFLKNNKVILYVPTFRDKGMSEKSFSELFNLQELNTLLEKFDAYFLYKSHMNSAELTAINKYERIVFASSNKFNDAQPLLYFSDIMITDYSGIYFDYLLMERPIIFYNYDMEEYNNKRGFMFDYNDNTPGVKVKTSKEVLLAIENYLNNPYLDSEKRMEIKQKFHKFEDGKACERTYNLIKKLM